VTPSLRIVTPTDCADIVNTLGLPHYERITIAAVLASADALEVRDGLIENSPWRRIRAVAASVTGWSFYSKSRGGEVMNP